MNGSQIFLGSKNKGLKFKVGQIFFKENLMVKCFHSDDSLDMWIELLEEVIGVGTIITFKRFREIHTFKRLRRILDKDTRQLCWHGRFVPKDLFPCSITISIFWTDDFFYWKILKKIFQLVNEKLMQLTLILNKLPISSMSRNSLWFRTLQMFPHHEWAGCFLFHSHLKFIFIQVSPIINPINIFNYSLETHDFGCWDLEQKTMCWMNSTSQEAFVEGNG